MKTALCVIGVAGLIFGSTAMAQQKAKIRPVKRARLATVKPRRLTGIDPAAIAIKFKIVSRTSQFKGRVKITGIVKNIGDQPYIDTRGGAGVIQLFRNKQFTTANLVAKAPLKDLKPGESQSVSFIRNWNSSSPNEGEFPPTYYLNIGYDVDITMDGCETNDDKRLNNNRKHRSGMDINKLFANTKFKKFHPRLRTYRKIGK